MVVSCYSSLPLLSFPPSLTLVSYQEMPWRRRGEETRREREEKRAKLGQVLCFSIVDERKIDADLSLVDVLKKELFTLIFHQKR